MTGTLLRSERLPTRIAERQRNAECEARRNDE